MGWRINVFPAALRLLPNLRLLAHAHGNHMAARMQTASATPSAPRAIGTTVTTSVFVAPRLLTGLWRISVFPTALRLLPKLRLLAHAHGNHMAARMQTASATPSAARAIGSTVTTSVSVA